MNLHRSDKVCREPPDGHNHKPHRIEIEHGHKYEVRRCVCGDEYAVHVGFPPDWLTRIVPELHRKLKALK